MPSIRRTCFGSVLAPAKSSNAFSVTRMMCANELGALGSAGLVVPAHLPPARPSCRSRTRAIFEKIAPVDLVAPFGGTSARCSTAGIRVRRSVGPELGVLMQRRDPLVVDVDELEVELLAAGSDGS
jgi:hypothetical protein